MSNSNDKPAEQRVDFAFILRQRRKFREIRLVVDERRSVTLLRPQDNQGAELPGLTALQSVVHNTADWSGWTEADLYRGGAEDPVPYDRALWYDVLMDDAALASRAIEALTAAVDARRQERKAASGNSEST
ncbi:MAG: hypothetical protein ACRCYZ_06870 [Alphaproteobacteria bacterium]